MCTQYVHYESSIESVVRNGETRFCGGERIHVVLCPSPPPSSSVVVPTSSTMTSPQDFVEWDLQSPLEGFGSVAETFDALMIPKTLAWCCFFDPTTTTATSNTLDDASSAVRVTLIDGFNVATMSPPTLMVASDCGIPRTLLTGLSNNDATTAKTTCLTLSIVTEREKEALLRFQQLQQATGRQSFSLDELGLEPAVLSDSNTSNQGTTTTSGTTTTTTTANNKDDDDKEYPPAVSLSPIHMRCEIKSAQTITNDNDESTTSSPLPMLLLVQINSYLLKGEILTIPPSSTDDNDRNVHALVDANKIRPIASLGRVTSTDNSIAQYGTMRHVHALLRPLQKDGLENTMEGWTSDDLVVKEPILSDTTQDDPKDFFYDTSDPDASKKLGYNPTKAIILPRPIGWISTYPSQQKDNTISHLAPYSFFAQLSRDPPLVAFSAYKTENGTRPKDAQLDAEQTGCFGLNAVTRDLAVPMNFSSASVGRAGDEFVLSRLTAVPAKTIPAPMVQESPLHMECTYLQTVLIGGFAVVIGRVRHVRVAKQVLASTSTSSGRLQRGLDLKILQPVTRLGYPDEYGVIDSYL